MKNEKKNVSGLLTKTYSYATRVSFFVQLDSNAFLDENEAEMQHLILISCFQMSTWYEKSLISDIEIIVILLKAEYLTFTIDFSSILPLPE